MAVEVIAPEQVRSPLELVTVQPLTPEPPASKISPVEMPPILTWPAPLASRVKNSSVPVEIVDKAKPPAAAAEVIFKPVTAEAVAVSTCKA